MKPIATVAVVVGRIAPLLAAVLIPTRLGHPVIPQMQQAVDSVTDPSVSALPRIAS